MENKFIARKDEYIVGGLAAVAASASVYAFACWSDLGDDFFGIFMINFCIACIYFCALWFSGRFRAGRNGLQYIFPAMVLFLISAYSLNHMIPIFEHAAPWLSVTVVVACAAYSAVPFFDSMPPWLRNLVALVMGVGSVVFVYLAIYLLPLLPVGIIASIGLGISLHAFAPLLFVIFTAVWLFRNGLRYRGVLRSFFCGSVMPLVVAGVFCWQWNSIDELVSSRFQHSLVDADTDLPSWIKVAQVIPHTHVAEAYLKGNLVYSTANSSWDLPGFSRGRNTFDEVLKHDPLVLIASLLNRKIQMTEEERIRILRSAFDARHKTEERLWSGADLVTTHVITAVKLWPQWRMAYTEKTITVANRTKTSWLGSQEAIYTFQLPEGGVVSSLSLWINGVESKGILTTKGKADSAYKSIVGIERRDPSVVHWQEGNKVSVRVFPVPQSGNRIFKIGITAPMVVHDDQLEYRNISFDGPWTNDAKELV
ncbi:MAG: XrtN system VIT domain-containing protein, partial [Sphingobacteriales bacterium]